MYGDTEVMRRQAGLLREQGQEIRALADTMVAQSESVPWTGRAADSMRERIRERATRLRDVAARHEEAAESMGAHVGAVDELKESISQVERRARGLSDDGGSDFEPPRPGHKDWLAVSLPQPSAQQSPLPAHEPHGAGS